MVKYFLSGEEEAKQYTCQSHDKITPICPLCGRKKDKEIVIANIYNRHSISCPYCGDGVSYPEKFMNQVLEQILNDNFIHQLTKKHFEWIGKYKYDFYFILNDKQYIIETDGGFHKDDGGFKKLTAEERKKIDDLKDKLAKKYNIEIIRIDCYESNLDYMKEKILKSKLKNLFNLSIIDWKKCHECALSNLVKQVCEYKKSNSEITTKEIAEKMKLSQKTIIDYLKKGTSLNWCEYDPKEEQRKAARVTNQKQIKSVEIFKDGQSLGKFQSIKELEEQSLNKFKIELKRKGIINVCKGRKDNYKGFYFRYADE